MAEAVRDRGGGLRRHVQGARAHLQAGEVRGETHLTKSVLTVVLQKSVYTQIRHLILYIRNSEG